MRSSSATGVFSQVGSITVNGVSTIVFTDNVTTSEGPHYYKVLTYDSCGVKVLESQISHTILLTGESPEEYVNSIEWSDYNQWPAGVGTFNLYLTVNDVTSPIPIATFSPGDSTFMESVINNFYSDGNFCYTLLKAAGPGNPYFFQDTARSNTVYAVQQPVLFTFPMPFHPGGDFNSIFIRQNTLSLQKITASMLFSIVGAK